MKLLFALILIAASFAGGFYWGKYEQKRVDIGVDQNDGEVHQDKKMNKLINPLLGCEDAKFNQYTPYEEAITDRINKEIINQHPEIIYSLYFRNLNNGPWFAINEKEEFYPASLLKVPTMMAYLKKSEKEPEIMNKEYVYAQEEIPMEQFVKPDQQLENGKVYTVEELIRRMIVNSDNGATTLLIKNMPKEDLDKTYTDLGLKTSLSNDTFTTLTTKNYATFFRILYNAAYLDQDKSEWVLELMVNSQFKDGLVAGVPKEILVSHKFGERMMPEEKEKPVQLHDCGIVYHLELPYVLCVMTKGKNFEQQAKAIADISKIVYEEIDKRY